ncbi:MAG: hypothetical protein WD894_23105 [Pirellulales bacterium]
MVLFWSTILIGVSTVTFIAGLFVLPALIVRIPFDYFVRERPPRLPFERHHPVLRVVLLATKNLLGAALIIAGVVMLVIPGPGLIAVLAGITLMDLPGKRALERWLIGLPLILTGINRLRARHGRPPLMPPVRQQFA